MIFAYFVFWFTSCVGLSNRESTAKIDSLVKSFNEFTGETINKRLMVDYLKVYNIEISEDSSHAKGVTLYD